MRYLDIFDYFDIDGKAVKCEPYGEGHINETYYAETDSGIKYILQKINNGLFKDVGALMNNIYLVTTHIAAKVEARGGDLMREVLTVVKTKDGNLFYANERGFFRVYIFIDKATAYQIVEREEQFYQSAVAFGTFQNNLADFDASQLVETIPNFHNTVKRFEDFEAAVKADKAGRLASVKAEVDFVMQRKGYCSRIVDLLSSGAMPLKVTHNDTKLNNVMIDDVSDKAMAVIDLDTVMPGSCCYDFGDSIRFGCNSAAEDERDLGKVFFRMDLFKAYAQGYLGALTNITPIEKQNLAFSAILMTYECGMRFLADHLNGDIYFRVKRDNHNLDRARTQFKLITDMEAVLTDMEAVVAAL